MNFIWKDYSFEYAEKIEDFLDKEAFKYTSCEDGFNDFYTYWYNELGESNFWCKVILIENEPIAVISLAKAPDNVFTVQEFIVSPSYRGKGCGSNILRELLFCSKEIIGQEISVAEAVIYPNNIASQKAFQKAGFVYTNAHPDGDAWYYRFIKNDLSKTAVKALVKNNNKILLLYKTEKESKADNLSNRFDLPGGRALHGETLIDALKREIFEETALSFGNVKKLSEKTVNKLNGDKIKFVYYECHTNDVTVTLSDEHESYFWKSNEEIFNDLSIPDWIKEIVKNGV